MEIKGCCNVMYLSPPSVCLM